MAWEVVVVGLAVAILVKFWRELTPEDPMEELDLENWKINPRLEYDSWKVGEKDRVNTD